jgi:etoposide-induced 2.4 mRNA
MVSMIYKARTCELTLFLVFKSLLLNSLSLASIYTLDLFFVPLLAGKEDRWLHRNFGSLYTVFWLLPVIGVSLYLNVSE